jgi:hypothetical protein
MGSAPLKVDLIDLHEFFLHELFGYPLAEKEIGREIVGRPAWVLFRKERNQGEEHFE